MKSETDHHRAPPLPQRRLGEDRRSANPFPETGVPASSPSRRRSSQGRPRRRHWLRWVAVVVVLALVPVGWSYGHALTAPGGGSVGVRTVEWVRGHGGAGLVAAVENWWYSNHPPPKGGRPPAGYIRPSGATSAGASPATSAGTAAAARPRTPGAAAHGSGATPTTAAGPPHLAPPAPITPIVSPPLPGEGTWHPAGRLVNGLPAVYEARLRPDPVHTSLVTGVAWMDPKLLGAKLFAGNKEPGGGPWPYMAPIPDSLRGTLVAAFNSGFKLQDSHGGYYAYGKLAKPLVPGAASLVIYKNGTVDVGSWGTEVNMGPSVAAVRQNLTLIIDHGKATSGVNGGFTQWGATVGNKVLVWRSGVGVTANGALLYAAGAGLSVQSLTDVLLHAGAVRAMEMDINSTWTSFFSFDPPAGQPAGPSNGTKLVPDMVRPPGRYFVGSARDFVAMFAR